MRLILVLCSLCFLASACNTVKGAGQDFKAAGSAISDAAEDTREAISD